jgi:hypothetical protein
MKESARQASKSKRLGNYIIDMISIIVISTIIVFVKFGMQDEYPQEQLIVFVIIMLYYSLLEGIFNQTIGKYLTKTQVVFLKKRNKWFWIIIRTLLRLNPLDSISYLFGVKYGIHDILSNTRVIEIEE